VLQDDVWRRPAKYPVRRPRRRRPRAPNAQPNAPGATLPHTQRPTPNALATTQRPKTNLHGSLRQREGCFRTTYRGASQSIPSGDLVVAAGRGIQRPPSKCYQAKGPPRGDPAVPPEQQKSKPAIQWSLPNSSLRAKPPSSPRGDPAFRVEQEMKGRRPKRPPFNQIRLPLQARAGNRPTN
jgi:hypothetical protein